MTLPAFNPYLNRTAIRDDRDFFGRRREMTTIFSRIEAREPQSVSIVGERRLGKSSLLRALVRRRTAFLDRADEFVFVYLDLQENMHGDASHFFSALIEEIALSRQDAVIAESRPTYENVRNLVAGLSRARLKLILLLDEFEAITLNRNFTIEFFSFLRSLPNNYPVSFIVSSARELQEICHSKEIAGSPFFNIFHKLNLGCLAAEEAHELIVRPSRDAGYSLEAHASFIHGLAGYFPLFLQMACCAFFEFHHEHPEAEPDESDIRQRFHEEARSHFEYLWDHFSERERTLCLKVSRREDLNDSDRSFLRNLTRRGYFSEGAGYVRLFSDAFDAFLIMKTAAAASHNVSTDQASVTKTVASGDLTGTSVGRFVVRTRLGAGGMGEVYLAEDTKLKRPVALKRMTARFRDNLPYRRRFLKEAERASRLSDPRIVSVYDFLEDRGEIFLVMEYVEGRTLRQTFDGPLNLEQFLNIAQQCAEAMTVAHEKNIIHCDIKPENIVITPGGQVKVLDFGLAKYATWTNDAADTATMDQAGVTVLGGTPGYMAPEVLLEQKVDARSDIFSLGVVFYEAVSGYHPFRSSTRRSTADRILREAPTPLNRFNAQIPAELERIVYRCLEKNPNDRYQCSRDLVADLILLRSKGGSRAASP
jgi:tRNA A-37 threonylcarbamoyl transferase component Bud32